MPDRHLIDGVELVPKRESKARLRREIFAAWGHGCAYCGGIADTLDHVHPMARGGLTVRSNLVPACSCCNFGKGHAEVIAWFRAQPEWSADRELKILEWITPPAPLDPD